MLVRLPAADEENGKLARIISIAEASGLVPGSPYEMRAGALQPIDYVQRNERNCYLGNLAEEIALGAEQQRLRAADVPALAAAARLVSEDPRLGYDLHSFDVDGQPRYIEVKSCSSSEGRLEFYLTENERLASVRLPNYWFYLVRESETSRPQIVCFRASEMTAETLRPVVHRATLLNCGGNKPAPLRVILLSGLSQAFVSAPPLPAGGASGDVDDRRVATLPPLLRAG